MKQFINIILFFILIGCTNTKQEELGQAQQVKNVGNSFNPVDSAYWKYTPQKMSDDSIILIDKILDSLEMNSYEASKQILKDMYINYMVRNEERAEDPEPEYYTNYNECKVAFSAFMNCLSHYLYTHGYRKINEEKFKEKLQTFYKYKWDDFENEDNFYSLRFERNKTTLQEKPDAILSIQNQTLIDDNSNSFSLKIQGEKWDNDGEIMGEEINRRMNMDSFINGELEIDVDWKQLLNQHLYLFNDNKAAKNWLLCHRMKFFIYNLDYYDDDDEINRKKLRYLLKKCTYEGEVHAGGNFRLIYHSILGLHNNMMKLIFEETDKAMTIYENGGEYDAKAFDLLYDYFNIIYVTNEDSKKISDERKVEQLEKLCVFLKMESSLNKKHYKYNSSGWFNNSHALSIAYQCLDDTLIEVAKQHNYYNIPNFDEVLKVYKWDSENAYRDKSGIPFDYTTLLE